MGEALWNGSFIFIIKYKFSTTRLCLVRENLGRCAKGHAANSKGGEERDNRRREEGQKQLSDNAPRGSTVLGPGIKSQPHGHI